MEYRLPLTANKNKKRIEELPAGDYLDLSQSGIISATSIQSEVFVGNLTGIALTAQYLTDGANILDGTIDPARLSGYYGIDVNQADYLTTAENILAGTINPNRLSGTYDIDISGTSNYLNVTESGNDSNYYPLFVSNSASSSAYIDSNYSLIYNPATNRLGINTNFASSTLTVNGDARIVGIMTIGSSSITLDGIYNNAYIGAGVTIYGDSGEIYLNGILLTSGGGGPTNSYWIQNEVGIYTGSNVGIGTTNILSTLSIQGNSTKIYDDTGNWILTFGDIGVGTTTQLTGSVAVDGLGNIYSIGLNGEAGNDVFLVKFDSTGSILWQTLIGVPGMGSGNLGTNIAIDSNNDIYLSLTVDTGTYEVGYIIKMDSSGNIIWQRTYGESDSVNILNLTSIGIGSTGSVYTTGFTDYSNTGNSDAMVIKYDNNGNIQYQKTFGSSTAITDYGLAIGIGTTSDSVYISGYTNESDYGGFISKFDSDGNILWQNYIDVGTVEYGTDSLVLDSNENVYTLSTTDYQGSGLKDIHIAKFDSDGNSIWQYVFGGYNDDYIYGGSACDSNDDIYVCAISGSSLIIFKFDSDCNIIWQRTLSSNFDNVLQFYDWSDDCIKIFDNKLIITGYLDNQEDIIVASLSTDGNFIGYYDDNYTIKNSNLSLLTATLNIGTLDFTDAPLLLTDAAGSIGLTTSNYTAEISYKNFTGGHALDIDGYLKVNTINPYDIDGNLGIGLTNSTTTLGINGTLGFLQYPDGYNGNSTNILIGDSGTGSSLVIDAPEYQGVNNNFIGAGAGTNTVNGSYNNFFGLQVGFCNIEGCYNNFFGLQSGYYNTTGSYNNFLGAYSGYSNTTGSYNNFLGAYSGYCNTTGCNNNFFGASSGYCNDTGCNNNFFGSFAGYCNTGHYNNFFGHCAGYYNSGCGNVFISNYAGQYNTTGNGNVFIGAGSGELNTVGNYNSFFGEDSGFINQTGSRNNFIGSRSGCCNISGSHNNFFGSYTGISTNSSRKVLIGQGADFYNFDSPNVDKDTQLAIGVRTDSNPANYWLVGDENFNIGIGTTNPFYKLDINGTTRIKGFIESQSTSTISSNILSLDATQGTVFTHTTSANIGIVSFTGISTNRASTQTFTVLVTQGAVGYNTTAATGIGTQLATVVTEGGVGYSTHIKVGGGTTITLTNSAGALDILTFIVSYDGSVSIANTSFTVIGIAATNFRGVI